MLHEMKLQPNPFASIKRGEKDIEMRLNDEKRKRICVGDTIRFTNLETRETLLAVVLQKHEFPSFKELYQSFDKIRFGYKAEERATPEDMSQYYPEEEIAKSGVVGLEIQLLQ